MIASDDDQFVLDCISLIRRLARWLIRCGQRPVIDLTDLESAGMESLAVDLHNGCLRQDLIVRHAKTYMIRAIKDELGHHRSNRKDWAEMYYPDSGREKMWLAEKAYLTQEQIAVGRIQHKRIYESLTESERLAYLWCEILGKTQREAADLLGISQQSVNENLSRAKNKF